ncbi:hypothetical protein RHODGE_RHODGE_03076 [Rhodoplanes serenus]|jgi:hypothetical protein|uniref:Flagellar basal-body protein FlbY n=1 Tax=Rhodoplanes serenus TaxID=200615 RepID=A0A3S4CIA3_9BRAD|nr:hypothetical protein [Rhodoplanes serenus]MBI5112376.1 hypothetical protein [Rhodovulum sp.]VCU09909.1 hypothetical protein RHODGE_RHODGE_03076 [Rhodoplanes serenus]
MTFSAPAQETPLRPIASADEARDVIRMLDETVTALSAVIEEESRLVRAGRLSEVARLAPRKTDFARAYLTDSQRLRDALPRLRGALGRDIEGAKARHAAFQTQLQANLTALATAHAVSEGIVRGVAGEVARTTAPQTYGASGRTSTADPRQAARPLAVYRSL